MRTLGGTGPPTLGIGLLKDTHNLSFQFREIHGEHRALRMEDQVASGRQLLNVTP
jgi:hypothetical protein